MTVMQDVYPSRTETEPRLIERADPVVYAQGPPDDHYKSSLKKQEFGVPDDETLTRLADEGGIATPVGPAGTVVFFDCNTMHGSNGNITPFPRSNAFFVYNSMENRVVEPFAGTRPRPEFIAAREGIEAL